MRDLPQPKPASRTRLRKRAKSVHDHDLTPRQQMTKRRKGKREKVAVTRVVAAMWDPGHNIEAGSQVRGAMAPGWQRGAALVSTLFRGNAPRSDGRAPARCRILQPGLRAWQARRRDDGL
jgi:hypothetical protein